MLEIEMAKNQEKTFRALQKKYVFKEPKISKLAGITADTAKEDVEFYEYFERTSSGLRKPCFYLGEACRRNKKKN